MALKSSWLHFLLREFIARHAENVNFDITFNGTLAVYKLDGLTLNFYVSTKTLQVQGRLKDKFIED